jgi:hypothetical protein
MDVKVEAEEGVDGQIYFFVINGLLSADRMIVSIVDKKTPTYVEYTDKATGAKRRGIV